MEKWFYYKLINEYYAKLNLIRESILKKEIIWRNEYSGKKIIDREETNREIIKLINSKVPFMVCRFGATEMNVINSYLQFEHFPYKDTRKQCIEKLCKVSGFFPNNIEKGKKFVELMLEDCKMIDLCGIWNLYMEDYVLKEYAYDPQITALWHLDPWGIEVNEDIKPWTSALKGRKVLIVHPFTKTINSQYHHYRTRIFERKFDADDILPEFELHTLKAVQTLNFSEERNSYNDWFDALDSMIKQCEKIDFDVAIIGCGAYGFPLAAAIKKMGKGAIHLGGVTQLLFGIMGKRWEMEGYREQYEKIINEYWTRPLPEEKIKNLNEIEGGCYW